MTGIPLPDDPTSSGIQLGLGPAVDERRVNALQSGGLSIGIGGNTFHGANNCIGNDNIHIGTVHGNVNFPSRPPAHPESIRIPLASWLSSLDFSRVQVEAFERRTEKTFEWLLETPEYTTWKAQEAGGMLLCLGKPGAGKTTFASFVTHTLLRQKDADPRLVAAVCYIYCRYDRTFTLLQLFELLLKQLILQCPSVETDCLQELKDQDRRPTLDEIISIIQASAVHIPNVFMVVDAVDECFTEDVRHRLLRTLRSLLSVKTLVTSRFLPSVESTMQGIPVMIIAPKVQDIAAHLHARAPQNPILSRYNPKVSLTDVEVRLFEKADGMFLLADLHITYLSEQTNLNGFLRALATLPKEASATYARALERIRQQPGNIKRLAFQALSWVYHAFRPLKMIELQYGVAFGRSREIPDENDLDDEASIISSCAGLLTLNRETQSVTFIHYTVREYMAQVISDFLSLPDIAQCCLRLIFLPSISLEPPNHPLIDYSASFWGALVRQSGADEPVTTLALSHLYNPDHRTLLLHAVKVPGGNAFHLVAASGLTRIATILLRDHHHYQLIDQPNAYGWTPLHLASRNGHIDIVNMLLDTGVDVNARNCQHRTALSLAAEQGHSDIVAVLLTSQYTDVNIVDLPCDCTPLHWATTAGHLEVVKLLVNHPNANLEGRDRTGRTACSLAASKGHLPILQFLATKHVDLSAEDYEGRRPLFHAASFGHLAVVEFLAKTVPEDIDREAQFGLTPLAVAAFAGCFQVVEYLVMTGDVNVNTRDSEFEATPFLWAVGEGHLDVVALLLAIEDVDVHARNVEDYSAVLLAAENGHLHVLELLLNHPRIVDNFRMHGLRPVYVIQ